MLEPHDPYLASRAAFFSYQVDGIPEPPDWGDRLEGRPAMYRKAARAFAGMTRRRKREAAACHYGMIPEIAEAYGELVRTVEPSGQSDITIIVFTAGHSDCMGARGLYTKNMSGYEGAFDIPLVVSGPGIARGALSQA